MGAPCEFCGGSGQVHVGHPYNRDVDCEDCDGTGLRCKECRDSKHGICGECSMDAVEGMYAD